MPSWRRLWQHFLDYTAYTYIDMHRMHTYIRTHTRTSELMPHQILGTKLCNQVLSRTETLKSAVLDDYG
jgi:hypothetical protein